MAKLKKIGKWVGIVFGVIVVLVGILIGAASYSWSSRRDARFETADHDFEIPALTDENRAEAERLYLSRGCGECHGTDGAGKVIVDAPPFLMAPPNITRICDTLSASDLHRLVRRGIRADGSPVFFMPAHEYARMPDEELGLIIAWTRGLPDSDAQQPASELRLLGRVLELVGVLDAVFLPAERVDQDAAFDPIGPSEMGEYLAEGCRGCHGPRLSGGPIPGAPEEVVGVPLNLTPHATGLEGWTLEQFTLAMREGRTPTGTLNTQFMPVRIYRFLTDEELAALFAFLQSVPALEEGSR